MPTRVEIIHVKLANLRTDKGTQIRSSIRLDKVKQYAQAMRQGQKFLPIRVYRVGTELWLVDGFHRLEAAKLCGFDTLEAEVIDGSPSDAIRASLKANLTHGLPLQRTQMTS